MHVYGNNLIFTLCFRIAINVKGKLK